MDHLQWNFEKRITLVYNMSTSALVQVAAIICALVQVAAIISVKIPGSVYECHIGLILMMEFRPDG